MIRAHFSVAPLVLATATLAHAQTGPRFEVTSAFAFGMRMQQIIAPEWLGSEN